MHFLLSLQIKAELTNISELFPTGDDFAWNFKVRPLPTTLNFPISYLPSSPRTPLPPPLTHYAFSIIFYTYSLNVPIAMKPPKHL
ncbi:hypothetical protein AYI70_g1703 [Smittium culicis]|uniref:Uncharacterized protein n=1 Tax=Smittium culicis TaxID=133412 RepID=A0A1R1YBE6_9FUNG|nr:hypothetical protein AYI70_g1703 [Smittium culicis]